MGDVVALLDTHNPAAGLRDTAKESAKRSLQKRRIDLSPSDALSQVVKRLRGHIL
jgi:hypothetical protein